MDISHICTTEQIKKFLSSNIVEEIQLRIQSKEEVYEWINNLLLQIRYCLLPKKHKGIVKQFIQKIADYSEIQTKRLISKHK